VALLRLGSAEAEVVEPVGHRVAVLGREARAMNAWTSCACTGVATLPVPMVHTGSYAITTFAVTGRRRRLASVSAD
jgi:hypothetical protein